MKQKIQLFGVLALALCVGQVAGMTISNLEFWVGSGTNQAALIIDWHDARVPHALTWGYRWNGSATGFDMWKAITNADDGISGALTNGTAGLRPSAIEYTRPAMSGDRLPDTAEHTVIWTAYSSDHTGSVFHSGNWSYWTTDEQDVFHSTNFTHNSGPWTNRQLANNSWDAWSFSSGQDASGPGWNESALHYPFANEIIYYEAGASNLFPDWITGELFTNANATLGRPTVDTTGDDGVIPSTEGVPVVPVYPALRASELVTLGWNSSLVLKFNHRVLDHPLNPYGIDLIVFGNSRHALQSPTQWTNGNPNVAINSGATAIEGGVVSVSQDGAAWHTYTNGLFADSFAPTLGRVYDPVNTDTHLGSWNQWWGGATDPTLPVDPSIIPTDWDTKTVAEIAERYRGSAGGVPFDLSSLPLPLDPVTGLKWIQYVRVENMGAINPEVDAVADVSPVSPYVQWRLNTFPWMHNPAVEHDTADPNDDNLPNLLEYVVKQNPFIVALCATCSPPAMIVRYFRSVDADDVSIEVIRADGMMPPQWTTNGIIQDAMTYAPSNGIRRVTAKLPLAEIQNFITLRAFHDR
ncbi:MAG: hypothetical protein KJ626_03000 [Verrucomicrobia bacterium]|nr:hypothetical protein [Verrucomicrobiota bacterium]